MTDVNLRLQNLDFDSLLYIIILEHRVDHADSNRMILDATAEFTGV